jgi:hypothetical protein
MNLCSKKHFYDWLKNGVNGLLLTLPDVTLSTTIRRKS